MAVGCGHTDAGVYAVLYLPTYLLIWSKHLIPASVEEMDTFKMNVDDDYLWDQPSLHTFHKSTHFLPREVHLSRTGQASPAEWRS